MGLQAHIDAGVAAAFTALGDLVEKATLQAAGTYSDVLETETAGATGTIDVVQNKQNEAERFFAGLNWRGIAGDTDSADITLLGLAASATLTPAQGMKITWRGDVYELHRIDDTQQALLMLGLRRPL